MGTKRIVRQTEARLFPEVNFIRDMVFDYREMAVEISEEEYLDFKPVS